MVRLDIDNPSAHEASTQQIFEILRAGGGDNLLEASKICRSLRNLHDGDPNIFHLSGIVAFVVCNPEAAKYFWAQAILLDQNHNNAVHALNDAIDEDELWSSLEEYMLVVKRGLDALIRHYSFGAKSLFNARAYKEADKWVQRISALNHPSFAQLHDLEKCRHTAMKLEKSHTLETTAREVIGKLENYWKIEISESEIRAAWGARAGSPHTKQLAEIVLAQLEHCPSDRLVVMELGCFNGFNLRSVYQKLPEARRDQTIFVGIEPNSTSCRIAQEFSPTMTFLCGDHRDMIEGRLDVPNRINICIISNVLMILAPEEVQTILHDLAQRIDTLVICDDIFNFDGDGFIFRQPLNFMIMHRYQHHLDLAGFDIRDLILADIPSRESTGFIVATHRKA